MDGFESQERGMAQPLGPQSHSEQGDSPGPPSTPSGQPRLLKRKYRPRASQACELYRSKKAKCHQGRPCQICKDREVPYVYNNRSSKKAARSPDTNGSFPLNKASKTRMPFAQEQERDETNSQSLGRTLQEPTQERLILLQDTFSNVNEYPTSMESESDLVIAINQQTSGTEFYGASSNIVSLNKLLSKARRFSPTNTVMKTIKHGSGILPDSPSRNADILNTRLARSQSITGYSLSLI